MNRKIWTYIVVGLVVISLISVLIGGVYKIEGVSMPDIGITKEGLIQPITVWDLVSGGEITKTTSDGMEFKFILPSSSSTIISLMLTLLGAVLLSVPSIKGKALNGFSLIATICFISSVIFGYFTTNEIESIFNADSMGLYSRVKHTTVYGIYSYSLLAAIVISIINWLHGDLESRKLNG